MKYLSLTIPGGQSIEAPNAIKDKTGGLDFLATMLGNALGILLTVGIIITLFVVVWSGIQWTSSSGNPQKVAAARGRLTWGVIGLVVQLTAFLVIALMSYFFKVDLMKIGA